MFKVSSLQPFSSFNGLSRLYLIPSQQASIERERTALISRRLRGFHISHLISQKINFLQNLDILRRPLTLFFFTLYSHHIGSCKLVLIRWWVFCSIWSNIKLSRDKKLFERVLRDENMGMWLKLKLNEIFYLINLKLL